MDLGFRISDFGGSAPVMETCDRPARHPKSDLRPPKSTYFFPVGGEIHKIVADWVEFLRVEKLFGPGDPLFPARQVVVGERNCFRADDLSRSGWSNATPIRKIFKEAFAGAGLGYANPHSFRKTLAQLGERLCRTVRSSKPGARTSATGRF